MANSIDRENERFESEIKYLKNYSYDDQTYSIYMDHGSLFIESDMLIFEILSSDDFGKCRIMKVFQNVVGPILQNILVYFTVGKMESETLKTNAMRMGTTSKSFEDHFNDDKQMNTLFRQNQDYKDSDLTLKFKCILDFTEFNEKLFKNESQKIHFVNIIKELKTIRNDLCHNRENSTSYHDLAHNLNVFLGDILEIMQNWDENIDILFEKEKMGSAINEIMIGVISNDDFRYMCVLKVLDLVVDPALDTVSTLICNKKKSENFKDYFSNNGIKGRDYKDRFFPKEKILLEGKSGKIKPDITLHVKLIDICKDLHPTLKDDPEAKEELNSIIKNIRGIRNHILHSILSMTLKECIMEAQQIVKSLNHLGKFALNKNLYMNHDVPVIDTNQIDYHIHFIMHLPYPYS